MPHSITPPSYWGIQIPSHWEACENFYFKLSETLSFPSQCGQDIFVNTLLHKIKRQDNLKKLTWIDIGCNDGTTGNSTLLIEAIHGKGLLVEPNYNLLPSIAASRSSPILCCCLSDNYGIVDLMVSDDVNTLSTICEGPSKARLYRESKTSIYSIPCPSISLKDVLRYSSSIYQDSTLGFIKIDAEGVEHELAKQISAETIKPLIIEIENNYRDQDSAVILQDAGYKITAVMDSFVEIWIHQNYFHLAQDQRRFQAYIYESRHQ